MTWRFPPDAALNRAEPNLTQPHIHVIPAGAGIQGQATCSASCAGVCVRVSPGAVAFCVGGHIRDKSEKHNRVSSSTLGGATMPLKGGAKCQRPTTSTSLPARETEPST